MLRILFRVRLKSDLNSLWISRCAKYSMSFTQNTSSFLRKKSFVVFVLLQQKKIWNLCFFVLIENRFKSFPSGNLRRKNTQIQKKKRRKWKFPVHLRLLFHHINFHAAKRVEIYFFDSKNECGFYESLHSRNTIAWTQSYFIFLLLINHVRQPSRQDRHVSDQQEEAYHRHQPR